MNRLALPFIATALVLAAACGDDPPAIPETPATPDAATPTPAAATPTPATPVPTPTPVAAPAEPDEVECPYAHHTDPSGHVDIVRLPPDFCRDWPDQDWSRHTVPFGQIIRGCGARDCIVALDAPGAVSTDGPYGVARFAPLDEVDYAGNLPIGVLRVGEVVRGYPLHVLTFHEIVNDVVAGVPVIASFCPLCNTVLAFDRRVEGEVLDFGVSGNLRHSDLIMWDRQTETWWQQATGEGIVGRHAGVYLRALPMSVLSFADFKRSFPDADILTEETDFNFRYGTNPFPNYDSGGLSRYFQRRPDSRLPALERVVALSAEETAIAVPLSTLTELALATVDLAGTEVVVFWAPGTLSPLDDFEIAASRDIGSAAAYLAEVDGRALTFTVVSPGRFEDDQTGSTWDVTGLALDGPLAGSRLAPVNHGTPFWFAWAAFNPRGMIWEPSP
ncbi:MAG: DUF3179 domain-containing protein [Chloroflexi bacterium]|nr:DUF3179 domain-containing protein [Chloroflexota bacterium]